MMLVSIESKYNFISTVHQICTLSTFDAYVASYPAVYVFNTKFDLQTLDVV